MCGDVNGWIICRHFSLLSFFLKFFLLRVIFFLSYVTLSFFLLRAPPPPRVFTECVVERGGVTIHMCSSSTYTSLVYIYLELDLDFFFPVTCLNNSFLIIFVHVSYIYIHINSHTHFIYLDNQIVNCPALARNRTDLNGNIPRPPVGVRLSD